MQSSAGVPSEMKKQRRRFLVILAVPLAVICAAGGLAAAWYYGGTTEYARFASPDGRHELIVFRHPRLYAMPGQGSDAPGTVVLVDAAGRELERTSIAMVQLISEPVWSARRVRMKLLLDWERGAE